MAMAMRALSRNVTYIEQQFCALVGNTSTAVKFICIVVIGSYVLSCIAPESSVDLLSVTPGYLLPSSFWLWTIFTFCFLEVHFWEVLVDIVTVGLCGKLIEPLWGQMEMLTFFAIVNIGVALISAIFYLVLFGCTANEDLLFKVHIHGLAGYIAGVAVTVKQIMPDHVLFKLPIGGKITNRNVPLCCICMSLIVYVAGLLEGTYPTMFISGSIISWIYLRFYQRHTNGTKGDMADNFCFASFFPNVLQPPIAVVGNSIYSTLVRIGICQKVVRRYDMANPTGVTVTLPGIDPHDMERRRLIALKALSERFSRSNENSNNSHRGDKLHQPLLQKTNKVQHHHHHPPIVQPTLATSNENSVPIIPNVVAPKVPGPKVSGLTSSTTALTATTTASTSSSTSQAVLINIEDTQT